MLDESYQSNKTKKNQSIETATCRICNTFHTNRNPLSLGGCAIITCENCYKEYKFLPTRCGLCQAYLCYRKYRSPLLSLQSPKKCIVINRSHVNKMLSYIKRYATFISHSIDSIIASCYQRIHGVHKHGSRSYKTYPDCHLCCIGVILIFQTKHL